MSEPNLDPGGADNTAGSETDSVSEPAAPAPEDPGPAGPTAEEQLAERTEDLQRLAAEYKNYRARAEREREAARAAGAEKVLSSLLTVLDDLGRAEEHGELVGGFKAVADSLQQALKSHDLVGFGDVGEPFDPNRHDAVFHAGTSDEVATTTIHQVMRRGYSVGDKVIRAAVVGVIDPGSETEPTGSDQPGPDQPGQDQSNQTGPDQPEHQ